MLYVTLVAPPFVTVRVCVDGPAWLSPRDSLAGVTDVVASTALSICSMPAPCRCTLVRNGNVAVSVFGAALFWRMPRIACAFAPGCACRYSATAAATWGDAIEVPLR